MFAKNIKCRECSRASGEVSWQGVLSTIKRVLRSLVEISSNLTPSALQWVPKALKSRRRLSSWSSSVIIIIISSSFHHHFILIVQPFQQEKQHPWVSCVPSALFFFSWGSCVPSALLNVLRVLGLSRSRPTPIYIQVYTPTTIYIYNYLQLPTTIYNYLQVKQKWNEGETKVKRKWNEGETKVKRNLYNQNYWWNILTYSVASTSVICACHPLSIHFTICVVSSVGTSTMLIFSNFLELFFTPISHDATSF